MSVKQEHFVVIGYVLNKEQIRQFEENNPDWNKDEKYQKYIDGHDDLILVYDGMNGEYLVFGHLIAKAEESDGLPFINLDAQRHSLDPEQVVVLGRTCRKLFGFDLLDLVGFPLRYLIFTHWS